MKFRSLFSIAIALLSGTLFSGCASFSGAEYRENIRKLARGMTEAKTLSLLGTPDSVIKVDDHTDRWIYEYKREAKKGHNLFIDFKDGGYARSGELSGRDIAATKEESIPGDCTKWQNPEFVEESICTH